MLLRCRAEIHIIVNTAKENRGMADSTLLKASSVHISGIFHFSLAFLAQKLALWKETTLDFFTIRRLRLITKSLGSHFWVPKPSQREEGLRRFVERSLQCQSWGYHSALYHRSFNSTSPSHSFSQQWPGSGEISYAASYTSVPFILWQDMILSWDTAAKQTKMSVHLGVFHHGGWGLNRKKLNYILGHGSNKG